MQGIIKEDVHRSSAGFLNSYFRVDGTKASHVMSGRLRVQLTEAEPSGTGRVLTSKKKRNAQNPPEPPKTTNARSDVRKSPLKRHRIGVDGAPASGAMKCLPVICHGNSLPPVHNRALPQQMVSRQEIRSGPDPWTETRHQVMTVMLRQLSTELKRIYKLQSIPINTKVQAELASNPPTSLDSLHALQINNLSQTMKQRYGLAIIAGVTQADHYVQQMKSSSNNNIGSAADFQLDTSQIFSEVRENTSLVGHDSASHPSSSWALEKDGWSDDDNNQWQTHHLPNFSRFEYTNANQRPVTTEHGLNNQSRSLQNNASSMATVEMQRQQRWKAKLTHGVERAFAQRSPPPARPAQATADCHVNTLTDDIDWL